MNNNDKNNEMRYKEILNTESSAFKAFSELTELLESTYDLVWEVDLEGRYTYVSDRLLEFSGFSKNEMIGKTTFEFMSPEEGSKIGELFADAVAHKTILRKIKCSFINKDGSNIHVETSGIPIFDENGNVKGYKGFGVDISEEVMAKRKFRENEELWKTFINTSPDGISITNLNGELEFASEQAIKMFRYENPEEVIGRNIFEFIDASEHDRGRKVLENLLNGIETSFDEYLLIRKDGTKFWGEVNSEVIKNYEGRPYYFIFIQRDVTEKKEMYKALKESEEKYRLLAENSSDVIWILDLNEMKYIYMSPSAERIRGYSNNEVMAMPVKDSMTEKSWEKIQKLIPEYLESYRKNEKNVFVFEIEQPKKNGEIITNEVTARAETDQKTGHIIIYGSSRNITDRKKAELALRQSEERWQFAVEGSNDGIWDWNMQTNHIYFSPRYKDMLGYGEDEFDMTVEKLALLIHPDDLSLMNAKLDNHIRMKENVVQVEQRMLCKDGTYKWFNNRGKIIFRDPDGRPVRMVGAVTDITERKRSEIALHESESLFSSAFESASIGMSLVSVEGKLLKVNKALCDILGYTEDELLEKTFMDISHPDDVDADLRNGTELAQGNISTYHLEKRYIHKSGKIVWILLNVSLVRDENGNPRFFIAQTQDISARKTAETALIESEEKHRALFENMAQGVIYQNSDGLIFSVNKSTSLIFGIPEEKMIGQKSFSTRSKFIGEDGKEVSSNYMPAMIALRTGKISKAVIGIINFENKFKWLNFISIPQTRAGEKKPYQVFTTIEDVSVQMELTRTQSELNLRMKFQAAELERQVKERTKEIVKLSGINSAIFNSIKMAVISTNADGVIESFNPGAEEMLEYKAAEVIGKTTPAIFHDVNELNRDLAEIMRVPKLYLSGEEAIRGLMLNIDDRFTMEYSYYSKSRKKIPVLVTVSTMRDYMGKLTGYVGVALDITERKKAEEALKQSEERFQNMFFNHDAVMLLVNPENGKIVEANKSASLFYGYDINEIKNHSITELNILPKQQVQDEMNRATKQNRNYFVFPHKLASGEIRIVEVHSSPIEFGNKKLLFSIIHDITERKQAEDALHKSEAENRAILESAPDLLFKVSRDGKFLNYHCADESMLYAPPEVFIGKYIKDVLPSYMSVKMLELLNEVFNTKELVLDEYELEIKGKKRFYESRYVIINDNEALVLIRDITKRKIAEQALQVSESKYRRLHESMMDGYVMVNLNGEFIDFNESFRAITGYSPDELRNLTYKDITPAKWHDIEHKIIQEQVLMRGYSDVYEKEYIRKDGEIRNIDIHTFLLKNDSGENDGFWAIVRDITERKRAEEELKLQSAAFEALTTAVVITDVNGSIQWANSAFSRLTGFSSEEWIGKNLRMLKSEKHDDIFYKQLWATIKSGKVWSGELTNRKKDGSLYYEDNTISPVFDAKGNITNYIAIKFDVTEQRAMEKALRVSEDRWQFAIEGSGDGVWDWNVQTNEVFYSQQWKKMFGYEKDNIKNVLNEWEKRVHPDDYRECTSKLKKYLSGELDVYSAEYRMKCKNGSYMWILDRGKIIEKTEEGKPLRVIGTCTNISKIKQLETTLRENLIKEKELNELKSRFISTASHEFRTPLASILLISESLISYWDKYEKKQLVKKFTNIKERVLHLSEIVNDVLHLSKIQEGKIEYSPEKVEIIGVCRDMIEDFNSDTSLENKIKLECEDEILEVMIDPRLFGQIMDNLLSNAIKYTPEKPRIKVAVKKLGKGINIIVQDNGIGIPEEDQKHIFGAFFRGSNTKMIQGNGLGLNIVKDSLQSQGGDLTFKSKEGKGSTFTVYLPEEIVIKS